MLCNNMDIHLACGLYAFINRVSCAEWMLKKMSQYFLAGVKLFVMYHIASTMKKYLEVSDNEITKSNLMLFFPQKQWGWRYNGKSVALSPKVSMHMVISHSVRFALSSIVLV